MMYRNFHTPERAAIDKMNEGLKRGDIVYFVEERKGEKGRFIGVFDHSGYMVLYVAVGKSIDAPMNELLADASGRLPSAHDIARPWSWEIVSPRLVAEERQRVQDEYEATMKRFDRYDAICDGLEIEEAAAPKI